MSSVPANRRQPMNRLATSGSQAPLQKPLSLHDIACFAYLDGALDEDRWPLLVKRGALLAVWKKYGWNESGGSQAPARYFDEWGLPLNKAGLIDMDDLRERIREGRITPTVRIYQSDLNYLYSSAALMERWEYSQELLAVLRRQAEYVAMRIEEVLKGQDAMRPALEAHMAHDSNIQLNLTGMELDPRPE